MAIDQFANWRRRLAGEKIPFRDGEPDPGFYRNRDIPVAFWFGADETTLRCHINGNNVTDRGQINQYWTYCCMTPVSRQDYDVRRQTGSWPNQSAAVTASLSNSAPLDPETFEGLQDQIGILSNEAQMLIDKGGAETQEAADQAADIATRLGELWKKADEKRVEEKSPHYNAAIAVDNKWRPLLNSASLYSLIKEKVITPFLKAAKARLDKEEADRTAAAIEAARLQREQDNQHRADVDKALATGTVVPEPPKAIEPTPPPTPATPLPTRSVTGSAIAGSRGRRVSSRKVKVAKINDYDAALAHFAQHADVKDLVQELATKSAKIGVVTPGCEIIEDIVAA